MIGNIGQWKWEVCHKTVNHKKSTAQRKKSDGIIIKFSCSKC